MPVALVIKHAKRVHRIMSCMAVPGLLYFSTLSYKRHNSRKSSWT